MPCHRACCPSNRVYRYFPLTLAAMRMTVTVMQDKFKAPVAQWLSSCEDEDREFLQVGDSRRRASCMHPACYYGCPSTGMYWQTSMHSVLHPRPKGWPL